MALEKRYALWLAYPTMCHAACSRVPDTLPPGATRVFVPRVHVYTIAESYPLLFMCVIAAKRLSPRSSPALSYGLSVFPVISLTQRLTA